VKRISKKYREKRRRAKRKNFHSNPK
jgi:hypothetical protein